MNKWSKSRYESIKFFNKWSKGHVSLLNKLSNNMSSKSHVSFFNKSNKFFCTSQMESGKFLKKSNRG